MPNFRPAGLSDDDSDNEDDYGYEYKIVQPPPIVDPVKEHRLNLERNFLEYIRTGNLEEVANIVVTELNNDVDLILHSGWTPLIHACFDAQYIIVEFFVDINADPNVQAVSITPAMAICANSSASEATVYDIMSKLIEGECNLNVGDKYGMTPLMKAVVTGRTSVIDLMLENDANIEMRDSQGWTALFYAIHHNQPECLEILLKKGARLNIVDMANRSPQLIAYSHNHPEIRRIISNYSRTAGCEDIDEADGKEMCNDVNTLCDWHEYYPGLRDETRPKYSYEIDNLLYGMKCDHLKKLFSKTPMDLRTFLLLEDEDMIKLGIDMPFERQRLRQGLKAFHTYWWKVSSVAGLQTERGNNYSMIKCVNTLGNHLQQMYIMEASLAYALRGYSRVQNKIKFEPPDSPTIEKLRVAVVKMTSHINNIRREISIMKKIHIRIGKDSVKPVDLITEKTTKEIAADILTKIVVISSLGFVLYRGKDLITHVFNK